MTATTTTSTTAPATRRCGDCGRTRAVTEFAFKDKATGKRQSRCRTCQSRYNKAHHAANKVAVNPRIHAASKAHREQLSALQAAARASLSCPGCGRTSADGVQITLLPPAHLTGGKPMSTIIRNGWSLDRFTALLQATVADPAGVRCASCLGRELGRGHRRAERA